MKTKPNTSTKVRIFAVDGNFYLHRIFHTQYQTRDMASAIANRFVAIICKDALAVKAKKLIVAFDGNKIFRYDVYKDYKANRIEKKEASGKESPYIYLPKVLELLADYGIPVIQKAKYEADDILCSIATQYVDTYEIFVGCRDKDAYQYVKPGVKLYDSTHKPNPRTLETADIVKATNLKPRQFLSYQLLYGDKIDNIPKLMNPAFIIKGLKIHGNLKQWRLADKDFAKFWDKNLSQLKLNAKLVRLVSTLDVSVPEVKWSKDDFCSAAYVAYAAFCKSKSLF